MRSAFARTHTYAHRIEDSVRLGEFASLRVFTPFNQWQWPYSLPSLCSLCFVSFLSESITACDLLDVGRKEVRRCGYLAVCWRVILLCAQHTTEKEQRCSCQSTFIIVNWFPSPPVCRKLRRFEANRVGNGPLGPIDNGQVLFTSLHQLYE